MGIENEAERSAKPATDAAHLERRIRERAYLLWESEGGLDGRADEYHRRAPERPLPRLHAPKKSGRFRPHLAPVTRAAPKYVTGAAFVIKGVHALVTRGQASLQRR